MTTTETTTAPDKDGFAPALWLIRGVEIPFHRSGSKPDPRFVLQRASSPTTIEEGSTLAAFGHKPSNTKGLEVGSIYAMATKDGESGLSIKFGSPSWKGRLADDAERQAIVQADRAARVALDTAKRRDQLAKADLQLGAILEPLLPYYRKCHTIDAQAAFEALVIAALRRGR